MQITVSPRLPRDTGTVPSDTAPPQEMCPGDCPLCHDVQSFDKEVICHRHIQIYHQRRVTAELPRRGRHQVDPLRCRGTGHRSHPRRRDAPRPCRLQGPPGYHLPPTEKLRSHGGPQCDQTGVCHDPLHRSPGRKRDENHVFQQHPHHLCDSKSGLHLYMERPVLSTHRTLISSKPNGMGLS